ncbi:transketolase [Paramagnetospirillum kuznetsovii]|uniref:Transketolase n=1 Tax=Paramagnetospirillum kuznetsovii TaxID=2053833 RepID=A0A364NXX0_9PROT|nr:transketolase C-terminal domain-containing protein [Paramagnetospirillum kuznetsovii]RAU21893.1 transketolase [Paramagnetospirillum kuznetsovii]
MTALQPRAMRDALLERIWENMATDERLFFVAADFGAPTLDRIRGDFPKRFINVGIAEQNLINVSAGLALEGFKVFAYAIAPFITMRCYEQCRTNLALLSTVRPMNVTLVGVGAGYSYVVSGPTHQCYEDITLMRTLPGFSVLSPADHVTAGALFDRCAGQRGLKYLRFDAQNLPVLHGETAPDLNKGFTQLRDGSDASVVATGYMVHTALKVADKLAQDGISLAVIDLFDLSGFDQDALAALLAARPALISMEEGFSGRGGVDSLARDLLSRKGLERPTLGIGVEPAYRFELGDRATLHEQVGIGPLVAEARVRAFLKT